MPSTTAVSISWDEERAELQAVLHSPVFARSPALSHLLSYLCEKTFAGETDQIKEYSVALDVFDRQDSFDQDTDSIVRVQANRLRKRLSEYYARNGAAHPIHITIPVGQYVPMFQRVVQEGTTAAATEPEAMPKPARKTRKSAKKVAKKIAPAKTAKKAKKSKKAAKKAGKKAVKKAGKKATKKVAKKATKKKKAKKAKR